MNKNLEVACPHCKKKFNYFDSTFRPFCCERCKMVDLGHWLNETYRMPVKNNPEGLPETNNDKNFGDEEIENDKAPQSEEEDENY
jgi:endogenous inhibitor of DNA gyrase (YacG/DUF329 family)